MKLHDYILALLLTLTILITLQSNSATNQRIDTISLQVNALGAKDNVQRDELRQVQHSLQADIHELAERVQWYEQSITFWNNHVAEMFGEYNARYFKEGRDK